MRPVNHVRTGIAITDHKKAKPDLINAMGEYCAYCERQVDADSLHVEHIKPQKSHSKLALLWSNFLLACGTCNTYKRHFQDVNRQVGILAKQAWPHLDNTFTAYSYDLHGCVSVSTGLSSVAHQNMADQTLQMAGLNLTPAVAANYQALGLIYDRTSRRQKAWEKAQIALAAYQQNPTDIQRQSVFNQAEETGFFSIWMNTFSAYPIVKRGLITAFKASPTCFDPQGNPLNPRQTGRI